jgi:hypothetical protein
MHALYQIRGDVTSWSPQQTSFSQRSADPAAPVGLKLDLFHPPTCRPIARLTSSAQSVSGPSMCRLGRPRAYEDAKEPDPFLTSGFTLNTFDIIRVVAENA